MADTRDPSTYVDEDPRKSISAAPSFEEYLKQRAAAAGGAPAAAAPAAAAPVAAPAPAAAASATGGGATVLGTLETLQGPGQVWGADGTWWSLTMMSLLCFASFRRSIILYHNLLAILEYPIVSLIDSFFTSC